MSKFIIGLVAAFLSLSAFAFSSSSTGNATTFGGFNANAANVGRYAVTYASDGTVLVNSGTRMSTPGGGSIPVNVTGSIPRASVAGALGRFAAKALPVLGAGVALYDLGQELGFYLSNASGTLQVTVPAPGYCPTAPCYNYQILTSGYIAKTTPLAAAQQGINGVFGGTCRVTSVTVSPHPTSSGDWRWTGTGNRTTSPFAACTYGPDNLGRFSRAVDTVPQLEPSSVQAMQDSIAAKTTWPAGSSLARATLDAIKAGDELAVSPQAVTGPATSPGPTTQTVNVTNNTTTTSTTTHHHTYSGPQVSTTTTTTVVTTDSTTGAELDRKTITETPVVPQTPSEPAPFVMPCGVPGAPPCAVAVDETGMATPETIKNDQADDKLQDWDNFILNIEDFIPSFPTINWNFALPTSCGVIPLPAFEPAVSEIDVCQFQPMFHQLMSVVWMLGGLFGAISLFMKSSLSD